MADMGHFVARSPITEDANENQKAKPFYRE
jgi:hypothetical protein